MPRDRPGAGSSTVRQGRTATSQTAAPGALSPAAHRHTGQPEWGQPSCLPGTNHPDRPDTPSRHADTHAPCGPSASHRVPLPTGPSAADTSQPPFNRRRLHPGAPSRPPRHGRRKTPWQTHKSKHALTITSSSAQAFAVFFMGSLSSPQRVRPTRIRTIATKEQRQSRRTPSYLHTHSANNK